MDKIFFLFLKKTLIFYQKIKVMFWLKKYFHFIFYFRHILEWKSWSQIFIYDFFFTEHFFISYCTVVPRLSGIPCKPNVHTLIYQVTLHNYTPSFIKLLYNTSLHNKTPSFIKLLYINILIVMHVSRTSQLCLRYFNNMHGYCALASKQCSG